MPNEQERAGVGRRKQDTDCQDHEQRLEAIENTVSTFKGWIIGCGVFGGLVVMMMGWFCVTVYNKLGSMETMLSGGSVSLAELKKDILSCQKDIDSIKERNEWIDRNGINGKRAGGR